MKTKNFSLFLSMIILITALLMAFSPVQASPLQGAKITPETFVNSTLRYKAVEGGYQIELVQRSSGEVFYSFKVNNRHFQFIFKESHNLTPIMDEDGNIGLLMVHGASARHSSLITFFPERNIKLTTVFKPSGEVLGMFLINNGKQIIWADYAVLTGTTVKTANLDGSGVKYLLRMPEKVTPIHISADGRYIFATSNTTSALMRLDLETKKTSTFLPENNYPVLTISPNGKYLIYSGDVVDGRQTLNLASLMTGTSVKATLPKGLVNIQLGELLSDDEILLEANSAAGTADVWFYYTLNLNDGTVEKIEKAAKDAITSTLASFDAPAIVMP